MIDIDSSSRLFISDSEVPTPDSKTSIFVQLDTATPTTFVGAACETGYIRYFDSSSGLYLMNYRAPATRVSAGDDAFKNNNIEFSPNYLGVTCSDPPITFYTDTANAFPPIQNSTKIDKCSLFIFDTNSYYCLGCVGTNYPVIGVPIGTNHSSTGYTPGITSWSPSFTLSVMDLSLIHI